MQRIDRRDFLHGAGASALLLGLSRDMRADAPKTQTTGVNGQLQGAEVGNAILAQGGNAVDAIVAAALTAGVVAIPLTGIGGYGGHIVISKPDGTVHAIDFNTAAPASMTADIYKADEQGKVKDDVNAYGWQAVGVPGVLAGLQAARDQFGTMPMSDLLKPAINYAKNGFPVPKPFALQAKNNAERLKRDPASAKLLFHDGQPVAEGATLKNPDLAVMLQTLANRNSVASFYQGDIADQIAEAFRKNGGWVTATDLAKYKAKNVKPLTLDWNGVTIHTPPPSSAGVTVLQTLSILKALGWPGDWKDTPRTRAYLEAMRIAWTDRLKLIGDPDFVPVPLKKLLSDEYAKESAAIVRRALDSGKPVPGESDGRPAGGTIHLNAMDATGLSAAMTFTHGGYFGAQVTVPGMGLVLGQGLSRFDPRAGRANSPAPYKRPLHNMCPTIVTRDGKTLLTIGATGGRRIVNAVTRVLAGMIGEQFPLEQAVNAPRLHTEGDMQLIVEPKHPQADNLKEAGYTLTEGTVATLTAMARDPKNNQVNPRAR